VRDYRYLAPARAELRSAAGYYHERSPRVAASFLVEIQAAIKQILAWPESAPVIRGEIRGKSLQRFPYKLIYRLDGDTLVILAVAHHRQRPEYWTERG